MPLKDSIGVSRKVGEPHFSPRGICVHLELKLGPHFLEPFTRSRERIHDAIELGHTAVDVELNGVPSPACSRPKEFLPTSISTISD